MLDQAVVWAKKEAELLHGFADFAVNEHIENKAYNEILTNPDVLSDYTLQFFGPQGPYPVYESEQQLETPGYPTASTQLGGAPAQMPAPPQQSSPQNTREFWNVFGDEMTRNPQNAWRVLNQANPNTMANKLFVME